jgi:UDP-N-acetylglucosamine 2-epimerase (non-hydrolysing)
LLIEGIDPNAISVTGNLAVETLRSFVKDLPNRQSGSARHVIAAFHRSELSSQDEKIECVVEVVSRIESSMRVIMLDYGSIVLRLKAHAARRNLILVPRLSLREYAQVLLSAAAVITDSSGLQDDTATLGIPCVTMRAKTHCIESIEAGTNVVVGYDPQAAIIEIERSLRRSSRLPGLASWGEGAGAKAAAAICAALRRGG